MGWNEIAFLPCKLFSVGWRWGGNGLVVKMSCRKTGSAWLWWLILKGSSASNGIFLFWAAGVIFIGEDAQDHGLFDSYHYHRVTHLAPLDYWTRCWRSALVGKPLKQTPSQPLSNAHSNHIVAAQWPGDDQSTMGHRCSWSSVVIRSTVTDTLPWNLPWTVPWWCDVSHPSSSEASIYYSHNWQLTAKYF